MSGFFPDSPGLAVFLNAGDPGGELLREVALMLDAVGVDCLELAVPFPNSVTDGPVIRRSADRALAGGSDLASTLTFVAAVRTELERLRIVLLADWRHTVRDVGLDDFTARVRGAGCDGVLVHGLPPAMRERYYASAARAGQPVVTTCYTSSSAETVAEAAAHASAFVYLVSYYGRTDGAHGPDPERLAPVIADLRARTAAPIAVGFGIRTGADVRTVCAAGADAAIVGSACVARVERSLAERGDLVADLARSCAIWGSARPRPTLVLEGVKPPE